MSAFDLSPILVELAREIEQAGDALADAMETRDRSHSVRQREDARLVEKHGIRR
jgi:hypothetical protein